MDLNSIIFDKIIYDACSEWKIDKRGKPKPNQGKPHEFDYWVVDFLGATVGKNGKVTVNDSALNPKNNIFGTDQEYITKVKSIVPRTGFNHKDDETIKNRVHNFKNALFLMFMTRARDMLRFNEINNKKNIIKKDSELLSARLHLETLKNEPEPWSDEHLLAISKAEGEVLRLQKERLRYLMPQGFFDVSVSLRIDDALIHRGDNDPRPRPPTDGVDTVVSGVFSTDGDDVEALMDGFSDLSYMLYCGD